MGIRLALLAVLVATLAHAGPSGPTGGVSGGGSGGGGGGHVIQDELVPLPQEPALRFTGGGVTCTPGTGVSVCAIGGGATSPSFADLVNGVNVNMTAGVCGNGCNLSASGTGAIAATSALALAADPMGCLPNEFATDIVQSGNLTCSPINFNQLAGVATDGQVPDTITVALAAQATALAADPMDCNPNEFATAIVQSGNLTCAQPSFSQLTGRATVAQVPDNDTTAGLCFLSGGVASDASYQSCPTSAFNAIGSGVNTTATMVCGTGCTVSTTGSGAILATSAGTATALANDPMGCNPNEYATDIVQSGNLTCAQPSFSQLTGRATAAQVPDNDTTAGLCNLSGGAGSDASFGTCPGAGGSSTIQFNVRDYGATGNGTTDDTDAINAAIAACDAVDGGTVIFPNGNYLVTSRFPGTTGGVAIGYVNHCILEGAGSPHGTGGFAGAQILSALSGVGYTLIGPKDPRVCSGSTNTNPNTCDDALNSKNRANGCVCYHDNSSAYVGDCGDGTTESVCSGGTMLREMQIRNLALEIRMANVVGIAASMSGESVIERNHVAADAALLTTVGSRVGTVGILVSGSFGETPGGGFSVLVQKNRLKTLAYGIVEYGSNDSTIQNNSITSIDTVGVLLDAPSYMVRVLGNNFQSYTQASSVHIENHSGHYIIKDNYHEDDNGTDVWLASDGYAGTVENEFSSTANWLNNQQFTNPPKILANRAQAPWDVHGTWGKSSFDYTLLRPTTFALLGTAESGGPMPTSGAVPNGTAAVPLRLCSDCQVGPAGECQAGGTATLWAWRPATTWLCGASGDVASLYAETGALAELDFRIVANATTTRYATAGSQTTENLTEVPMASAARLSNMRVYCTVAPGGGGTYTMGLRVNGADAGPDCDLVDTATTCEDLTEFADVAAGDRVTTVIVPSVSPPPGTAPTCYASFLLTASGGTTTTHNTVLVWGNDQAASSAVGAFCAPGMNGDAAPGCTEADESEATFVVPRTATLTNMAALLSTNTGGTEAFKVRNVTTATELPVTCSMTGANRSCLASCSGAACTVTQGDRLTVRYDGPTVESRARHLALEFSGTGQWLLNGDFHAQATSYYSWRNNSTAATNPLYRASQPMRLRNLFVVRESLDAALTATLMAGSTPTTIATVLTCTIASTGTTCSDTGHIVDLAVGDYWNVRVTGPVNATDNWVAFGLEQAPTGGTTGRTVGIVGGSGITTSRVGDVVTVTSTGVDLGSVQTQLDTKVVRPAGNTSTNTAIMTWNGTDGRVAASSACTINATGTMACPADPLLGGLLELKEGVDDGTNVWSVAIPDVGGCTASNQNVLNQNDCRLPLSALSTGGAPINRCARVDSNGVLSVATGDCGAPADVTYFSAFGPPGVLETDLIPADTCRCWALQRPFTVSAGLRTAGYEVTTLDPDDTATIGEFSLLGVRNFSGTLAVLSDGVKVAVTAVGSPPALGAGEEIVCIGSGASSGAPSFRLRRAASADFWGPSFTVACAGGAMPTSITVPSPIPLVNDAGPPAVSFSVFTATTTTTSSSTVLGATTSTSTSSTTSTTSSGAFTALPDWCTTGLGITACWSMDEPSGNRSVRGNCANNTSTGCQLSENGPNAPVAASGTTFLTDYVEGTRAATFGDCGTGTFCNGTLGGAPSLEDLRCNNNTCEATLGGTQSRTYGCKVKLHDGFTGGGPGAQAVMGRRTSGSGWALFVHGSNSNSRISCEINGQSFADTIKVLVDEQWHSIACVYDNSSGSNDFGSVNGQNIGGILALTGEPLLTSVAPGGEPYHMSWDQNEPLGGTEDDCFLHVGVTWTLPELNRWNRCGLDGKLCMCDGAGTSYLPCTTNADCRPAGSGNTTAQCDTVTSKCEGLRWGRCTGGTWGITNGTPVCTQTSDCTAGGGGAVCTVAALQGAINCNAATPN